jgi:hypothetical protein
MSSLLGLISLFVLWFPPRSIMRCALLRPCFGHCDNSDRASRLQQRCEGPRSSANPNSNGASPWLTSRTSCQAKESHNQHQSPVDHDPNGSEMRMRSLPSVHLRILFLLRGDDPARQSKHLGVLAVLDLDLGHIDRPAVVRQHPADEVLVCVPRHRAISFIILSSAALNAIDDGLASASGDAIAIPGIGAIGAPGFIGIGEPCTGAGCCASAGLTRTASIAAA